MAKLLKIVSFLATCSLLLNGLGQIDLASWGVNGEWQERIEMVLQGKEILEKVTEVIPWGKTVSEHAIEIQVGAALPGIILVLIKGIFSLLKFLVGVGILTAVAGMAFVFLRNNPTAIAGWASLQPQQSVVEQYQTSPARPVFVPLILRQTGSFRQNHR
jgi:hypothetical protein